MKLLIIGNGSVGIHDDSKFYINNHTGHFLQKLNENHEVTFAENSTIYDQNNNLQNFEMVENGLNFNSLPNKKSKNFLPAAIKLVSKQDFLYLFYPGTLGKIIAFIAILLNKPFGMYIRGQYYNQNVLDRFILKRANFVLTVSPAFVIDLAKFCPRVDVIKPMIDINQEDLKMDRIYENCKIKNLLFVGRVEERKGIFELLEIAKNLKDSGCDFMFNIVGGGNLFEPIKEKISEYDLGSIIVLHGLISNKKKLKALYDEADLFIFTSHDEGFPRVLYEAMASSLPIFTSFVGGIPGRMQDLKNCIEIPVKNSKKAADIILMHYDDKEMLESIGVNGLKTIEKIINGSYLPHEDLLVKYLKNEM